MRRLKRIGVLSAGLHIGAVMGVVGLLAGIFYSVGGFIVDLATIGLNPGTWMAFGALVAMPALFAAAGCLFGAGFAAIYNLVARWFGGMELGWDDPAD